MAGSWQRGLIFLCVLQRREYIAAKEIAIPSIQIKVFLDVKAFMQKGSALGTLNL